MANYWKMYKKTWEPCTAYENGRSFLSKHYKFVSGMSLSLIHHSRFGLIMSAHSIKLYIKEMLIHCSSPS